LQDEFQALWHHVSSFRHPIFSLLDENHRDEPQRGFRRRKNTDRSRSAADLAIEMFDWIVGGDLAMVFKRKCQERQRIRDAGIKHGHRFRQRIGESRSKISNRAIRAFERDLRKHRFQTRSHLQLADRQIPVGTWLQVMASIY
jgi:hypothetical protein